jgi:hypothetical protein
MPKRGGGGRRVPAALKSLRQSKDSKNKPKDFDSGLATSDDIEFADPLGDDSPASPAACACVVV